MVLLRAVSKQPSKHRNSADRLSHLEAVAGPVLPDNHVHAISADINDCLMVILFVNCYISKYANNINAVFILPTKIIPPPCTQRTSLSLRRLRRLGDTWCNSTKITWNNVLWSEKSAKKSGIIWKITEKCLSLQHERKRFPPAEMKE